MNQSKSNVPVLMVFFNRPEPVKEVFEAVREARPSKLFIAQDGARLGNKNDEENILKCREVVKDIDWDCEVYYDYSDVNLGCGRRMSSAITWAFGHVDRLMILEDDCVPSRSFFPFCEELLEKYKDDERVNLISAMNHLETYEKENGDSYIFCNSGAIWGWATWKRQWDMYDFEFKHTEGIDIFDVIKKSSFPEYYKKHMIHHGKDRLSRLKNDNNLSSWTYQFSILRILNNQLSIVPTKNMVSNIGLTSDSTHASGSLKLIPKGLRSIFYMKRYDIDFPLVHPKYLYCDNEFDKKVWTLMGVPGYIDIYRKIESIFRRLIFSNNNDRKKILKKFKEQFKVNSK